MKPIFNLDHEMNGILESDLVKDASIKNVTNKNYSNLSLHVKNLSEMAIELDKRGMCKTAASLLNTAKIIVKESDKNSDVYKIGELYGLV